MTEFLTGGLRVEQAIQKRITRRIALIVGAFALGLAALYGLNVSLERRNEDMRQKRVEVREFFRVLTLFQGNFDTMVKVSGALGGDSPLVDPVAFVEARKAAVDHAAALAHVDVPVVAPRLEALRLAFDSYAAAAETFLEETRALGLSATRRGAPTDFVDAKDKIDEIVLASGDPALLAPATALGRGHFRFLRDRIFNDPAEIIKDQTGDRDGLLRTVDALAAAIPRSALSAPRKADLAAQVERYRAGAEMTHTTTRKRSAALITLNAAQTAVGQSISLLRQALFAENDKVYAKEEEYRDVSRTTVGVAVVLLSLGFVFLIVVIGGRLRREAFLEQDRAKIFKDFALSSRSVSWETDASCRYIRRETSGTQDDSVPGSPGLAMIEAETHPNIEFDGVPAFDLVGERKPYRDILFAHTSASGQKTWWRSSGTPYYDVDGRFLGYRGITIDVTETKNYEHAVADTVARSRDFAAASSDERWEIDGEGVVRALETQSPFAEEMRRIGLGRRFAELAAIAETLTEDGESLDRYIELRQPFRDVVYSGFDLRTGRREWYRMSGVPFFDARTGAMGMRCVNARITKTRVLELENAERQRQLEALVSDLPIIVQRMRTHGPRGLEVTYVSPGIETILGIPAESLLGPKPALRFRDIIHPDDRQAPIDAVHAAFESGKDYEVTYRARTSAGVYRTLQGRGRALIDAAGNRFVESIALDVTEAEERREREAELQTKLAEAQKMEAIGRLAGGIAHDFNNILGATRSFGDLLADGLEGNPRLHGYATRIVAACDRAADMVRQILTFTRAKDAPREVVKVAEAVHEVQVLLGSRLPPRITLAVSNREPDAVLVVNPSHMTQVLLNLAVNAADALDQEPAEAPGRIEIGVAETTVADVPPFTLGLDPSTDGRTMFYANGVLTPGQRYLRISVSDTGPGIPPEVLTKIFDPFFTTKDKRKGSGLGLPVVTGIVNAQGGVVAVESALGKGTTFNIYFPAVRPSRAVERAAQAEKRAIDKSHIRGRERILIVDDEIDVADALSYALTNLGYETAPVYSPTEALEIFTEGPDAWDVLITDQSMPDLKGLDLIRRIRFIRPGLRTILCTGYSDTTTESAVAGDGVDAFFTKPVPADVIAAAVRSFFDAPHAARA